MKEKWTSDPVSNTTARKFNGAGMRDGRVLYGLHIKWEKWRQKRGESFSRLMSGKFIKGRELIDTVYDFLNRNKYDSRATNYIYDATRHHRPMKKESFFAMARKEGLLGNVSNDDTAKALAVQIKKQLSPLWGRLFRLEAHKGAKDVAEIGSALSDVGRIIGTKVTGVRNIDQQIQIKERLLRRPNLSIDQAKWVRAELRELKKQRGLVMSGLKGLQRRLAGFSRKYESMPPRRLKSEWSKLIKEVSADIRNHQEPALYRSIFQKTAGSAVNRVAQSEFLKGATQADRKENESKAERARRKGKVALFRYTLSAAHNIVDICDDHASGDYGWEEPGVGEVDDLPVPGKDTHPHCECRIEFFKEVVI